MELSIIIPVWNEEKKIKNDILDTALFLEENNISAEIIVVDDGSEDCTVQIAEKVKVPANLKLNIIHYDLHRGKGYALRAGISESTSDIVMFMDSGRNVPLKYILKGLELLRRDTCDIVIGSRHLPESIIYKSMIWYRRFFSILFRNMVKFYLKIPSEFTDTQCGFKMYHGNIARNLYKASFTEGFMFDLEVIIRAKKLNYRFKEIPIEWTCDRDSRLSVLTTPLRVLNELRRIKELL